MKLTLDLGTSATKAALWSPEGLVALGRGALETAHPQPAWAEQDPEAWWSSTLAACHAVRRASPQLYRQVDAIGFSAARETFTLVDEALTPLLPGILWSDARAQNEADLLSERWGGAAAARAHTGVVLNAAAHAAKVAWVAAHEPAVVEQARWIVAPRDLVVARMTGEVITDPTLASRTGAYTLDGAWHPDALPPEVSELLPAVRPSASVVGTVLPDAAAALGLDHHEVAVIAGAGDRACEALGVGATARAPMVSWGTTANVSVPLAVDVAGLPSVAAVSFGALGGYLLEAGVSASGAAVAWLASITGLARDELLRMAAAVEPGARGLVALPWLHGARGPWWRPEVRASFTGLDLTHGPAEMARAVLEAVALDVARCVELVAPDATELRLAGGGAGLDLWREVLGAVTGLPLVRRQLDEAASVGACIVVGAALGEPVDVDALNPVVERVEADTELVGRYRGVRKTSDATALTRLRRPR